MSEDIISQLVKQLERLQKQVDGLVKPEVGNLTQPEMLAAPYSLINGTFLVWQRGTSFAAVANNDYSADRWIYQKTGAMVHTITRDTSVPTVAESGLKLPYSIKLDVTTIDGTIAAGDYCTIETRIEGYNFLPLAQREFILSFWVRDTITGIHCVAFRNSVGDRSYVAEYTINTADTWEYKTITVSASPSAGTWDYTTGIGLNLDFTLACGSVLQTTADTWQTGNYLGTSSQVNGVSSTSNNFYLAGIMLTPGSVPADTYIVDYGYEFGRCQRYYELIGFASNVIRVNGTAGAGGEVSTYGVYFKVSKRTTPTATRAGTWGVTNTSQPTSYATSESSLRIQTTSTAGGAWEYVTNSVDDGFIIVAEL